jgi:hypothetical protein
LFKITNRTSSDGYSYTPNCLCLESIEEIQYGESIPIKNS